MSSEYIYLKNKKIKVSDLSKYVPFTMVNNSLIIIDICEFVCNSFFLMEKNQLKKSILINLLKNKSQKIKNIAAVVMLSKKEEIIRINCNYISSEFSVLFKYSILFDYKKNKKQNFIDSSEINSVGIKYFINLFYRLIRNRKLKQTQTIIRTWVDVSEKLYKEQFNKSTILIYPFGLNFKRGLKYIKNTFSKYENVSFMGIPYSFKKFIKIFLSKKKDLAILDFEIDGHIKHAKDLENYKTIYTSDDFISAVPALYNEILPRTKIINTCHGIGFYNPFNNYNEFYVINGQQKKYYNYKNFDSIFYKIKNVSSIGKKKNDKFEKVIVIIDQGNLKKYNFIYEHKLQQKVYSKVIDVCEKNNIKLYIKPHPNRNKKESGKLFNRYPSLKAIENLEELKSKNIIFINLYSGAYNDYKNKGKFIFIKDEFFSARIFFGNQIKLIKINEIERELILS